jgi:hypothetical protein
MREIDSFKKESDPKEDLRVFALGTAIIGIMALALWGLYYLITSILLSKPLLTLFSAVGHILESTVGNLPLIGQFAILFLMMAGILEVGSLLKNEKDIDTYKMLVKVFWIMSFAAFMSLWMYSAFNPIPVSSIIGISFIFFIAPPFVFGLLKGISLVYEVIKQ